MIIINILGVIVFLTIAALCLYMTKTDKIPREVILGRKALDNTSNGGLIIYAIFMIILAIIGLLAALNVKIGSLEFNSLQKPGIMVLSICLEAFIFATEFPKGKQKIFPFVSMKIVEVIGLVLICV